MVNRNGISCSSGRAKIVDPNDFDGFKSENNFPVQLEDLNVSVFLTSFRRGRTLLTGEANNNSVDNIAQIQVNFIEGSKLGNERVLTTKYTDLTTSFDKGVINDETLGITSIDISFDSSETPLVTINFVDIRGSSIFQNEENIIENSGNKYTTFFQLPYPLFELEIKGFYGLPVKYCLHMLKFTSKFNSQTGNFEITANFVGYTFAMLSDMLLGYMKAIPFTKIGGQQFDNYNNTITENTNDESKVLKLNDLSKRIGDINKDIKKESSQNESSVQLNTAREALTELENIRNQINFLGISLDLSTKKDSYDYIVFNHVDKFTANQEQNIKLYKDKVKEFITKYNSYTDIEKIVESDFINIEAITNKNGSKIYKNITINELKSNNDTTLAIKLNNPSDILALKENILKHLTKYNSDPKIGDAAAIDIFDMTLLFEKIGKAKQTLELSEENAKKQLAESLQATVRNTLKFEPTARKIMECFTASIEVLVESIYLVAQSAISNSARTSELAKKFNKDNSKSTDMGDVYLVNRQFFPWPDYREKDESKNAYIEKYLGSNGVLERPENVDELVFIEDLLQAFRKSAKAEIEAKENMAKEEKAWFPVNIFDSQLFSDKEPYERAELLTINDVARLMVIRTMTSLGYSHNPSIITPEEIIALAEIEVDAMLRGVKDTKLRQAMTQLNLPFFKSVSGIINKEERKVLKEENGKLTYDYIFKDNDWKILPINKGFNNEDWGFPNSNNILDDLVIKRRDNDYLFLTNYNDYLLKNSLGIATKADDGGTYIKILDGLPSPLTLQKLPEGATSESVFILEKLKEKTIDKTAGFNIFGGDYGIQEFKNMDWGEESLKGLPLMYVFYSDSDNGLAYTRNASAEPQGLTKSIPISNYSFNINKQISWSNNKSLLYKSISDNYTHYNLGKNRVLFNELLNGKVDNITYPYIELRYQEQILRLNTEEPREAYDENSFSLFGSELYYNQCKATILTNNNKIVPCMEYSKAFLFLHSLPFNINLETSNPFGKSELLNIFNTTSGLIHAPKLWCAYIGSILWRSSPYDPILDNSGKIIGGGRGKYDPIDVKGSNLFKQPDLYEYFPVILEKQNDVIPNITYSDIEETDTIYLLPAQVKDEFKRMFFDFVNGTGSGISWRTLADTLEIFQADTPECADGFSQYIKEAIFNPSDKSIDTTFLIDKTVTVNNKTFSTKIDNIKNYYDIITPVSKKSISNFYVFLELKDNTLAVQTLIKALTEESIIVNANYRIWGLGSFTKDRTPIQVDNTAFETYFNKVIELLKSKADEFNPTKQNENLDMSIFGTTNKDIIRLQLYKVCKNIYDKWLGGAKDIDHLVFQCGGGRSSIDSELAKKYNNTKTRMIDSFRFVTRSFRDIGDSLYINPIPINDYLIGNLNTSAYDMIAKILASNNFTFQPLPNFINYRDDKILASVFKPYSYYENRDTLSEGTCGPSFVCVYAGQPSKHLDAKGGNYPNDGFDLRCMNGTVSVEAPEDFISSDLAEYEEPVSTFVVKYSQQNQNIFKDVILDQAEISETDESIHTQQEISQKGAETNRAIVGQNIYNVFAVRSYTAQVEMMGNAMIQPMMYFQLDNIPMFHGAYFITKVTHSIKPNSMLTNFTGTRIRYPQTPLINSYDIYMDMIDTLNIIDAGTGKITSVNAGNISGNFAPIIVTIRENGGDNGKIVSGQINIKPLPKIEGLDNEKLNNKAENALLSEAVEPFVNMMKEYVKWLKDEKFPGINGNYVGITGMFRDYAKQVEIKDTYGDGAATPGTSNHGWGIAVDLKFFDKQGVVVPNKKNKSEFFKFDKNPAIKWLYDNSYRFGWLFPFSLRDGSPLEEHWHFEYHGTSAKCMMEKNPTIYGYTVNVNKPIDPSVKNPKTTDGKEAVYTSCDVKYFKKSGDGTQGVNKLPTKQTTDAETEQYFKIVLKKLNAPETEGNLIWFKAWRQMEGGQATWNAFNSTQVKPGSTKYNSYGVQNYLTMEDGADATYKTLANGKYPNIVNALRRGIANKKAAYDLAVELQKTGKDLCIWVKGPKGCASQGGIPASSYLANCLNGKKISGDNIYKPLNGSTGTENSNSNKTSEGVIVYGGVAPYGANWMKEQWVSAGLSLTNKTIIFEEYTGRAISQIKTDNPTVTFTAVMGFSGGGPKVWPEVINNEFDFVGLIDPSTNATNLSNYAAKQWRPNVKMMFNPEAWTGYPAIRDNLREIKNGITNQSSVYYKNKDSITYVNSRHTDIPLKFLQTYGKLFAG